MKQQNANIWKYFHFSNQVLSDLHLHYYNVFMIKCSSTVNMAVNSFDTMTSAIIELPSVIFHYYYETTGSQCMLDILLNMLSCSNSNNVHIGIACLYFPSSRS